MVWGVVLPRVTPLVAARTAVLGFGMGVLCASRQLPALMSSVVTILGSGWKAGQLCGGKIALLLVLELRFCACYLGISEKCWGGRM